MLNFILFLSMTIPAFSIEQKVEKMRWNDLEVVWIQDERFPVYDIVFYFSEGSLGDHPKRKGESKMMFSLLTAGTRRFNHKEISDNLEFFGVSQGVNITHEYSSFFLSGLTKDIIPTVKLICHLFKDSTFPKQELKKEKRRIKNSLEHLVSSHGSLASRAFREISLDNTPFSYPVSGKIRDLPKINRAGLKEKLQYFNTRVKKRIYLTGPPEVLLIKSIVSEECGWKGTGKIVRNTTFTSNAKKTPGQGDSMPTIHLVTVPKANQAQIRIGRHLEKSMYEDISLLALTSSFLAGGSSSRLMQEARSKRGLTYGIYAFAAGQKDFGRAGIFSSTRNESVDELLSVIKATLDMTGQGKINKSDLKRSKAYLSGSHFFQFERTDAYSEQLIYLDHVGKNYSEFYNFQNKFKKNKKEKIFLKKKKKNIYFHIY
ncbi:MAG: pitrilysin family protein, partial [Halobacteriovoraceae bacterium]|nr:pitrilysin family protein [Halobacteriovoraceae bacterium]